MKSQNNSIYICKNQFFGNQQRKQRMTTRNIQSLLLKIYIFSKRSKVNSIWSIHSLPETASPHIAFAKLLLDYAVEILCCTP
jgi:hypothetical protein